MRLSIILLSLLGTGVSFTPSAKIAPPKSRTPITLKAFGFEDVSALVSLELTQSQQPIIAAAVAALGLIGVAFSSGKSDVGSSPAKETKAASTEAVEAVDVSIPYNAAAMLEYSKLMGGKFDAASFEKFQSIYEAKVVAQVTAKKVARDSQLEIERLQAIAAKADAEIAELK